MALTYYRPLWEILQRVREGVPAAPPFSEQVSELEDQIRREIESEQRGVATPPPTAAPPQGAVGPSGGQRVSTGLGEIRQALERELGISLPDLLNVPQRLGQPPEPYKPREISPWIAAAVGIPALIGALSGSAEAVAAPRRFLERVLEFEEARRAEAAKAASDYENRLARAQELATTRSMGLLQSLIPYVVPQQRDLLRQQTEQERMAFERDREQFRQRLAVRAQALREAEAAGLLKAREESLALRRLELAEQQADNAARQAYQQGRLDVARDQNALARELGQRRLALQEKLLEVARMRAVAAIRAAQQRGERPPYQLVTALTGLYRADLAELDDLMQEEMNLPVIGAEEQKQKIAERRALIEQRLQQRQQDLNVVLPYVMQKAMPSQPQAPGQPTVPTPPQTPVPAPAPAVPPSRPGQPSGRAAPRPAAGAPAPSPRAAQILQAYRAMPNAVKVSLKKMTRGPQGRPITRWDSLTEAERAWLRAQGVAP